MANPQPNQYTKISNELLEHTVKYKFNATQLRIIMTIWRYTYGFHRKEHELSLNFIANSISSRKSVIKKELDYLIEHKVVSVIEEANFNKSRRISFNKNYDEWCIPIGVQSTNNNTAQYTNRCTGQYTNRSTKKENIKENIKENNIPLQIKNLRLRYSDDELSVIDNYFDILRWTRKNGAIADSVILKIYQEWEKYSIPKVIYALEVYINNPNFHDKKENYCYGIMRNSTAEEIKNKAQKPKKEYKDENPFLNRG